MSKTADDIERMLRTIEGRQVRCPECGSTDAHMKRATYELMPVRFTMTGEVIVGETQDYATPNHSEFPSMLVCHPCNHEWPVPEGTTFQWESIICECEEAKLLAEHQQKVLLSAEQPPCQNGNCGEPCLYVVQGTRSDGIPFGRWVHVDTRGLAGEAACQTKATGADGKLYAQYARVTLR